MLYHAGGHVQSGMTEVAVDQIYVSVLWIPWNLSLLSDVHRSAATFSPWQVKQVLIVSSSRLMKNWHQGLSDIDENQSVKARRPVWTSPEAIDGYVNSRTDHGAVEEAVCSVSLTFSLSVIRKTQKPCWSPVKVKVDALVSDGPGWLQSSHLWICIVMIFKKASSSCAAVVTACDFVHLLQ